MDDRLHISLDGRLLQEEAAVVTTAGFVEALLPVRPREAHKGDFGRVLIVAGSVGYTGAPALAANAALRSGAGLIFVGVPAAVYPIVAAKLDEPMVFPLPDEDGMLSEAAIPQLLKRMEGCDAVLIGPGLGRSEAILSVVRAVLESAACPVVLDADGINALEGHIDVLGQRRAPIVLTPHDGEFRRLGGDPATERRVESVRQFADRHGVTVLLKGHRTLICGGGKLYCNPTGNPGMATGGSGDVLAGLLLSLLGQGVEPTDAAAAAAWLHGAAGDLCAETIGEYGMTPSDVIDKLPRFLP